MIDGLIEVILYVQEMNDQVHFYQEILGLQVTYPQGVQDYTGEMWVTFKTGACVLALHGGGEKRIGRDAPTIVFGVSNIQSARTSLVEKGVAMGEIRSAAPGIFVCDGKDPEGNSFSIESQE